MPVETKNKRAAIQPKVPYTPTTSILKGFEHFPVTFFLFLSKFFFFLFLQC